MKAVVLVDLVDYTVRIATSARNSKVFCSDRDDALRHVAQLLDAGFNLLQVDGGLKILMTGDIQTE